MSVAFDAVTVLGTIAGAGGPFTGPHAPAGTPTAASVKISCWNNGTAYTTITSVTYGASAMALAAHSTNTTTNEFAVIFGLANPPAGTQTVTVNFTGSSMFGEAFVLTVTGSDTTTCFSNVSADTSGNSATPSCTCVSATGELVVDIMNFDSGSAGLTWTKGGSQTFQTESHASTVYGEVSTQPGPGSPLTMSWTNGGTSGNWAHAAASFKLPGGGGSTASYGNMSMMGVGHHKGLGWTPLLDRRSRVFRQRPRGLLLPRRALLLPLRPLKRAA